MDFKLDTGMKVLVYELHIETNEQGEEYGLLSIIREDQLDLPDGKILTMKLSPGATQRILDYIGIGESIGDAA